MSDRQTFASFVRGWTPLALVLALAGCATPPPPKVEPPPTTLTWPKGVPHGIALQAYEEYAAVEKVLAGYGVPVLKGQAMEHADVTLYFARCDDLRTQGTVARIEETRTGRLLLQLFRPLGGCELLMRDVAEAITTSWRARP